MKPLTFRFAFLVALATSLIGCTRDSGETSEHESTHAAVAEPTNVVHLDEHKIFHAGIMTGPVEKRSEAVPLSLPGRISIDQRRPGEVSGPVAGRGDKTQMGAKNFEGMQSEFVQTVERTVRSNGTLTEEAAADRAIYAAAKGKLLVIGLTEADIAVLEKTRVPETHFHIRAPFAGTIIKNDAKRGSYIQVGTALMELADLSTLWVLVDLYEKDLPFVKNGMIAEVRVAASTETVRGTITTIYGVMDEKSRTVKARLQVDNARGLLRPEMFATVMVQTRLDAETIKIPLSALLGEPRKHYVFVALNDSTFEKRDVRTGFEGRDFVEILDGLLVDERLVTTGGFFLKSELAKETFGEEH